MRHTHLTFAALLLISLTTLRAAEPPKKDLPLPGEVFSIAGHTAFIIPAKPGSEGKIKAWVWYAPTLPGLPGKAEHWMFEQFLDDGIAIAGIDVDESYGSPAGRKLFTALYAEMTGTRGYSKKPVMLARSRGGLMDLSWAEENPDKVAGFAGIYPVSDIASYPKVAKAAGAYEMTAVELQAHLTEYNPIDRLAPLAKARVPLFAIHGDVDTLVPLADNSARLKKRYTELGGTMELIVAPGQGHNMWPGFFHCRELVDFVKACFDPAHSRAGASFPDYQTLLAGPQQVRLLPGQHEVVFSMYGVPGELEKFRALVDFMREQHLGNGFDPGVGPQLSSKPIFDYLAAVGWPMVVYPGADMQIKGGRCVLGRDNETAFAAMDRAGVFTAVQLGEWGYYFHNLAPAESWWRDNFGKDFDKYKHLMKPAGLAGYDRRPASKQECYDVVKDYFASRSRDLLGRVISVTGHSHYEAYAGEWGARCIGLEVGENIAFTQSKLAFARGASRQWSKPWSVQVSPWFDGACTTGGPLVQQPDGARGLDAGHSLSFYERMWLHGWFAGAAMVTPENSRSTFFEKFDAPWILSSHGKKAIEVFGFMREHDRGVPYTPVAVVLDHLAGYNAYMDKPWGILQSTAGDRELRDFFDHQLFPGSDHIHTNPFPNNPELSYLRPTPYGEIFDVLLTSVPPEILPTYPVILLAGDIQFDNVFLAELEESLRRGSRVLMSPRHREALGADFQRVSSQGNVEVLEPWTNPETGRPTAISNERLSRLTREVLPLTIEGDAIEYQINRVPNGWVIELINNLGVTKRRDQPALTNSSAVAHVTLKSKLPCSLIREWRSGQTHQPADAVTVEVGPGATEFVEFTTSH